jgi:hypothetical protein
VSVKVALEFSAPVETGTPLETVPTPLSIFAVPPGPGSKTAVRETPFPGLTLAVDAIKLSIIGTKDIENVTLVCLLELAVREP